MDRAKALALAGLIAAITVGAAGYLAAGWWAVAGAAITLTIVWVIAADMWRRDR